MYEILIKEPRGKEIRDYYVPILTENNELLEVFIRLRNSKVLDFQLIFRIPEKKDLDKNVFIHLN
jgi:hypothetical protein